MAGVTLQYDSAEALALIRRAAEAMGNPEPMLLDMGEHLQIIHRQRFAAQTSPDGVPWAPLSPGYLRRKKKNRDKILVLDGRLSRNLVNQVQGDELLFGTNIQYAAIHQFGGTINIAARPQEVFFRTNRDGAVGNRFSPRKRSNFAQSVTIGPYTIHIPARPWLGTSSADDNHLGGIALDYIRRAGFGPSA